MKQDVQISVIMPSWNTSQFLKEALDSILSQSHPPHEIIVQDGGSTDGTLELLDSYGSRVKWFVEKDRGQSDAVNRAIARASGDLIGWLNADDVYVPGAFSAAAQAFVDQAMPDLVFGDWDLIDADGGILRRYSPADFSWSRFLSRGCYVFSGATFFRRDVFQRFGGLDERLHYTMDLEYFLRIGRDVRTVRTAATIAQLRMHDSNKSTKLKWRFVREGHSVRWRHVGASLRRTAQVVYADVTTLCYLSATPLRFSKTLSTFRSGRRVL